MKIFKVYRETVSMAPTLLTQIHGNKAAVATYVADKLGGYEATRLKKTRHGYSYEVGPFHYLHFTSEFE